MLRVVVFLTFLVGFFGLISPSFEAVGNTAVSSSRVDLGDDKPYWPNEVADFREKVEMLQRASETVVEEPILVAAEVVEVVEPVTAPTSSVIPAPTPAPKLEVTVEGAEKLEDGTYQYEFSQTDTDTPSSGPTLVFKNLDLAPEGVEFRWENTGNKLEFRFPEEVNANTVDLTKVGLYEEFRFSDFWRYAQACSFTGGTVQEKGFTKNVTILLSPETEACLRSDPAPSWNIVKIEAGALEDAQGSPFGEMYLHAEPLMDDALALQRTGVRNSVLGIGTLESWTLSFQRPFVGCDFGELRGLKYKVLPSGHILIPTAYNDKNTTQCIALSSPQRGEFEGTLLVVDKATGEVLLTVHLSGKVILAVDRNGGNGVATSGATLSGKTGIIGKVVGDDGSAFENGVVEVVEDNSIIFTDVNGVFEIFSVPPSDKPYHINISGGECQVSRFATVSDGVVTNIGTVQLSC